MNSGNRAGNTMGRRKRKGEGHNFQQRRLIHLGRFVQQKRHECAAAADGAPPQPALTG